MNNNTKMLVEGGIMIAFAYVLSMVKVYEMPNGGSVTAASMLPILIYAIRWGKGPGLFVAITYGLLQFLLGTKWSIHPVSILCDYLLGFGILGLAGMFGRSYVQSLTASIIVMVARFVFSVISGMVAFQVDFVGSVLYNATYMIPELVLTVIVYSLVFKPLSKHQPVLASR